MALGLRFKENPRARVYCILGDGEMQRRQRLGSGHVSRHYHLDNLIAIVDYNKVMAKGFVWDLMSIEPLPINGAPLAGTCWRWTGTTSTPWPCPATRPLGTAARQTHRDHRPHRQRARCGNGRVQLQMAHPRPRRSRPPTRCCASFHVATAVPRRATAAWRQTRTRRPSMAESNAWRDPWKCAMPSAAAGRVGQRVPANDRVGRRPAHLFQGGYFKKAFPDSVCPGGHCRAEPLRHRCRAGADRFHPLPLHLCRLCRAPGAGPDRHLDLLSAA